MPIVPTQTSHDVIVVGSGMIGAWTARELAAAGLRVLILEAGPEFAAVDLVDVNNEWIRERAERASTRQFIQRHHGAYWNSNPRLFVDDLDHPYRTADGRPFVWIRGRQLGGRSLTWGGVTLRFSDYEFSALERDGHGPSWPLTYHELAPYYDRVERYLGIQGSYEAMPALPDGVFLPPPALTPTEQFFKDVVERRWSDRRVIHSRGVFEAATAPGGIQWPHRSSLRALLPAAVATGLVEIRSNCIVSHLSVDPHTSKVNAVACVDRVTQEGAEIHAPVVVLCASTIESLRIMLNSKNSCHHNGIGNSSGHLGRFLVDHASVVYAGTVPGTESLEVHPTGGAHGIIIPRFSNLDGQREAFIRGYGIWGALQRGACTPGAAAPWYLTAMLEVLPSIENGVSLDDRTNDAWGIPVPKIDMQYSHNELQMRAHADDSLKTMIAAAGLATSAGGALPPGTFVHELGGARMGIDARTSVLNPFNQCWDSENLFVLDGACFVSSGWQNPTLTMMAIAARACGRIIDTARNT